MKFTLATIGESFMKRVWIFLTLIACPLMTVGQNSESTTSGRQPYQPAVPPPSTSVYNGGGYGYSGGQTAQGGAALQGMSQVISTAGEYNLATSAAAINMTEAQSNAMRNDVQHVQTFWEMRNIRPRRTRKERSPKPTPEELARRARRRAPRALNTNQIDPVTGEVRWPTALQEASFEDQRGTVQEYAAKWVKYGALDYNDQKQVRENIDSMFDSLKSQIQAIPPQDYVASRSFLQSLLYATTRTTL